MARTIEIEDNVTVGSLAEKLNVPVTQLIGELMKNGVMATVNERIDFDTAQIIVGELGLDETELVKKSKEATEPAPKVKKKVSAATGPTRPPVVAVMGHVDHGKTSLLDAIRSSEVVKQEAGGITQHISAYQVDHNGRLITFLDTPGHEAFGAIRSHGAELTDLVIIVVAADDGVKPQTIEALRFAKQAGSRLIIAINKIDKPGADPNRVKQQLAEQGVMVEGWGGDVVTVEVSAKEKKGIDALLDMIILVADVEDLRASIETPSQGLIIESHMEVGRGPVAHALVTEGILKVNDYVVAGGTYAKIRTLQTPDGKSIKEAPPSTPVVIMGFKALPEFADTFIVAPNEKAARTLATQTQTARQATDNHLGLNSGELISIINRTNKLQELPVVIKADVQGSLTSVIDSLKTLETEEVAIRVVSSGVGAVNESDVHAAHTSTNALIYGFNVTAPNNIMRLANRDKVSVRLYNVIYELLDDAKEALGKLLAPEIVEKDTGMLEVRGIFKTSKTEIICGGEVMSGKLTAPSLAKIVRGKEELAEVEITNLKKGPADAKEVLVGEFCGLNVKTKSRLALEEGDKITFFTRETVERKL
jgi:translation initiation factor IF-2